MINSGYKSRKMVMAYVAMLLITAAYLFTGWVPSLSVVFAEFCMAILGATTVYVGGNTVSKWVGRDAGSSPEPSEARKKKPSGESEP